MASVAAPKGLFLALRRLLNVPMVPRFIAWVSGRLPRRFIQGRLERIRSRYEQHEGLGASEKGFSGEI